MHTNNCKNLVRLMQEPERIVEVSWDVEKSNRFLAGLYVLSEQRSKFLSQISDSISDEDCNIVSVNLNAEDSLVNCIISIEVYDVEHLRRVIKKIKKVDGVILVDRLNE